jgi:lipopolysaccharide biosynthesis glycosyltransferase
METIEIFLAADENYAPHLAAALASFCQHASPARRYRFHLIHGPLAPQTQSRLQRLTQPHPLLFHPADPTRFSDMPVSGHISAACYFRIAIPLLLPEGNRALYLDCDLVAEEDLAGLWDQIPTDRCLAAAEDAYVQEEKKCRLGLPEGAAYFNSGVMALNLERFRKLDLSHRLFRFIAEHPEQIEFWDQDALNALLPGEWNPLPPRWNQQRALLEGAPGNTLYSPEQLDEARQQPSIIHYTSQRKPWQAGDDHPFGNRYWHYLRYTPWRFRRADRSGPSAFKRLRRRIKTWLRQRLGHPPPNA